MAQQTPNDLEKSKAIYTLHSGSASASLQISQFKDPRFPAELRFSQTSDNQAENCQAEESKPTDLQALTSLLTYLISKEGPASKYTLYVDCYHEVDDELMKHAAIDPYWYRLEAGNPSMSVLYAYLGKLLNTPGIAPELDLAVQPVHYIAEVDKNSLEKLWTTRVDKLDPRQRSLLPANLKGDQVVPLRISKAFLLTRSDDHGTGSN